MKKTISVFMVLVISILTLTGCSKEETVSLSQGKTKVFASISNKDSFISTIVDGMEGYASSNNIQLDIKEANKNVETQVEQIKNAQSNGYDAIVCVLVDANTTKQIITAAGDLPVIFINVLPDESLLKEDKYIYIASDENQVIDETTKYLENKFGNKSFDVVMLEGTRDCKATIQRSDDLKLRMQKAGLNANFVFQDEADWSAETAKEKFEIFLNMNKKVDAVLCNNDDMALGVVQAMEEGGMDPQSVLITGVDAISDACKAIADGKMGFTLKQSGKGQGESAMIAAETLKSKGKISKIEHADEKGYYIWYPYETVDKSNVQKYIE